MSRRRLPSIRPPATRPQPTDGRPKNQRLATPPTEDVRRLPPPPAESDSEVIVVARSRRRKTDDAVTTAADRSTNSPTDRRPRVTDADIARRAYLLYLARGCKHGHDVDDWLQSERALRGALSATEASGRALWDLWRGTPSRLL